MSEAKKYDRSYKEQSVKLALEIGVKRASEDRTERCMDGCRRQRTATWTLRKEPPKTQ